MRRCIYNDGMIALAELLLPPGGEVGKQNHQNSAAVAPLSLSLSLSLSLYVSRKTKETSEARKARQSTDDRATPSSRNRSPTLEDN